MWRLSWAVFLLMAKICWSQTPCSEIDSQLDIPCTCNKDQQGNIDVFCDRVAFPKQFPLLPYRLPIVRFYQRYAFIQDLSTQLFTASDLPLRKVDFSHNNIRSINNGALDGIQDTLEELVLSNNRFGNTFEKVFFTSSEISELKQLQVLDLSSNSLRGINETVLRTLKRLVILKLEDNDLDRIPSVAIDGLESLKVLTLQDNNIGRIRIDAFSGVPQMTVLNASHNRIKIIEEFAFASSVQLKVLDLSYNKLSYLESNVFGGLSGLEELDLSNNFLSEVPADSLKLLEKLRFLRLKENLIQNLGGVVALGPRPALEHLDLSRNIIGELPTGTFRQLSSLRVLKLGVNSVHTAPLNAFDGLKSLVDLELSDDNIFTIPSDALSKIPSLKVLSMNYNRIAAISSNSFRNVQEVQKLSIAYNLIRDIPNHTFKNLTKLQELNLYGNLIQNIGADVLQDLRSTLQVLNVGKNNLHELPPLNFPSLYTLILSKNRIQNLVDNVFLYVPQLRTLDLSGNELSTLPANVFYPLSSLSNLDLSENQLTAVQSGQFNESIVNVINLRRNKIQKISKSAFQNLILLHTLDLSYNEINEINDSAFYDTPLLQILKLENNRLKSFDFKAFEFSLPISRTELIILDLGKNNIENLYPEAFIIHPKLSWLNLEDNKLTSFPGAVLRNLTKIESLNLEGNKISSVKKSFFSSSSHLRELNLKRNDMTFLEVDSFENSSQLQQLDLSFNKLSLLPESLFKGVARLNLDMSNNRLAALQDNIFSHRNLDKLISIDLSYNFFKFAPLRELKDQTSFLWKLNLAHNMIRELSNEHSDIPINVKHLDLSYNPLTSDAITQIFEPKTVEYLNLAGTSISDIPKILAPFIISLNLSHNNIKNIREDDFSLLAYLKILDLSYNEITTLSTGLARVWPKVIRLKEFYISHNPLTYIDQSDLLYLDKLEILEAHNLPKVSRIERRALDQMNSLKELHLHSFEDLKVLDTRGILETVPGLEVLDIELKDEEVHDQLHPAFHSRLKSLSLRGQSVKALSGGAFAGINSNDITIGLLNTSITNIRSNVFIPVPMSSKIVVNIHNSNFTGISADFIQKALRSHQRDIKLYGLETNPLYCDCHSILLQNWLLMQDPLDPIYQSTCKAPEDLNGLILTDLRETQLTCIGRPSTTTTDLPSFTTTHRRPTTDNIITIDDMTKRNILEESNKISENSSQGKPENMDTLIIGIVGGVVALLAILIIIVICMVCLRSDSQYRGGPLAGPFALRQSNCTCLKPLPHAMPPSWAYPPAHYPAMGSHAGTLKVMPPTTPLPGHYNTVGAHSGRSFYSGPSSYHLNYAHDTDER